MEYRLSLIHISTNKNNAVLLKVVTNTWNVRTNFDTVRKSYSGNLSEDVYKRQVVQFETADGASPRPIAIMIGPVTTGGKNLITFSMPSFPNSDLP